MTQTSVQVALVEDDVELARWIAEYLREHGMLVEVCHRGDEAVDMIRRLEPDIVLLDLNLPGKQGHRVCQDLRAFSRTPVLVITANDDEVDEVLSLEMGADDFVAKPVRPRALLARIHALLRRAEGPGSATGDGKCSFGGLVIDQPSRAVVLDGEPVSVSDAEFDLLWLLAQHAGEVVSRQEQSLSGE